MNDDRDLIERLKTLDRLQLNSTDSLDSESLAQDIVHLSCKRRTRRRRLALVSTVVCAAALCAMFFFNANDDPRPNAGIARDVNSTDLIDTDELVSPNRLTLATDSDPSGSATSDSDLELQAELRHWRSTYAHLQNQLHELESVVIRGELSKAIVDYEIESNLFF